MKDINLFGAYLAGVVDGDGSICIKRPKYPQCKIKITSGKIQHELAEAIKTFFNCYVGFYEYKMKRVYNGRLIEGKGCDLEFYISNKNMDLIEDSLFEHLTTRNKRDTLNKFFDTKHKKALA